MNRFFVSLTASSLPKPRTKKTKTPLRVFCFFGGAKGTRTPDLCVANASLYQLSYNPTGLVTIELTRPRTIKSCGLKSSLVAVRKIFHRARRVKFWWRWGESNSLPTRIGETFYKFSQSFEVADSVGTANKAHRRHVAESVNASRQERKEVRRLR